MTQYSRRKTRRRTKRKSRILGGGEIGRPRKDNTGIKKFPCTYCRRKFHTYAGLKNHTKLKHFREWDLYFDL